MMRFGTFFLGALALSLAVGCGDKATAPESGSSSTTSGSGTGEKLTGSIDIDGSSTVFPIANLMGEGFAEEDGAADVKVTVNKSGTGSGFQKFERGEIQICTASRPIKEEEDAALKKAGIEYVELPIAYDGVSIVVNPSNDWVTGLTVADLKKAYTKDSPVKAWKDLNPAFPAEPIKLYGPTDNHGTYEYFQEAVLGKKQPFRTDYQANQEYNAIIQSVAGDKDAIAYVGYNYFAENTDKVKAVPIDGVLPSDETIANGTYRPLSRPLFIYVAKKAMEKPEVKAFLNYAIGEGGSAMVKEAKYVPLPADAIAAVKKRLDAGTAGSAFMNAEAGKSVTQVLGGA